MPVYLVELYTVSGVDDPSSFARLCQGTPVRYVRSILIPGDETCLHLVSADSLEVVAVMLRQCDLKVDRIVQAVAVRPRAGESG